MNTLLGMKIANSLLKKKKFTFVLLGQSFFIIFGLIVAINSIKDIQINKRLQEENVIVTATTYPHTRKSLSGEKYNGLYYEWNYNNQYYSAKIPAYDGFVEKDGPGNFYKLYIDKNNPNIFFRIDHKNNTFILGLFLIIVFSINLIVTFDYRKKALSNNFKRTYGLAYKCSILFFIFMLTIFTSILIISLIEFNIYNIIPALLGMGLFLYILLITPEFQMKKNYNIKFIDNNLNNLELYYKNKKVNIIYKIDSDNKIALLNDNDKPSCISYFDNSKMSSFTKYKIINYFAKWLNNNNLLSNEFS